MIELNNPIINGREISSNLFVTGEEKVLGGGSGETPRGLEGGDRWFIPFGVLKGQITVEEAIAAREQSQGIIRCWWGQAIGFPGEKIALNMQPIDPETGQTVDKPKVLGICVPGGYREVTGRDLNQEFWSWYRQAQKDEVLNLQFPIREDKEGSPEGQKPSVLEKE